MLKKIKKILENILGGEPGVIEISVPEKDEFGHFSTNVAMRLAKERKKPPLSLAKEFAEQIKEKAPAGFFEMVEAVPPGFVNVWIKKEFWQNELENISHEEGFGTSDTLKGKMVMVEFTDPNPFKLFHIGHLMSNTIGESFARLHEAAGAKVIRANYQSDVGLHVANAIWGMQKLADRMPEEAAALSVKVGFLGEAYATGTRAHEEQEGAKEAIGILNEKIYSRSDAAVNELYDRGRAWSLAYFETIYKRLGTKFEEYFFESEIGKEGLRVIAEHKDVFEVSDGATVFRGERYGLHTRVFVNSKGLPTYEAKELGLNKVKFERYPLDLSIIVTGNDIVDYFKVLMKVMEFTIPDVARRTRHIPHGNLRLPSGKMSSRTGDVVTAEALLGAVKERLRERASDKADLTPEEREAATEAIAVGAVKCSILKQNPGQDIVFDFEKSLSITGDSGPYLQYAYARLQSILRKAGASLDKVAEGSAKLLGSEVELALIRRLAEFPNVVAHARETFAPSALVTYLYKLAAAANRFYEATPIIKDEDPARRAARLMLVQVTANTIRSGLELLGIRTLEKI